jgi:hypothetical protein
MAETAALEQHLLFLVHLLLMLVVAVGAHELAAVGLAEQAVLVAAGLVGITA